MKRGNNIEHHYPATSQPDNLIIFASWPSISAKEFQMKKSFAVLVVVLLSAGAARAQEFGLSFSYFLPRNGYFSTPVSPFSLRGVGVNLNKYIALETGGTLYRMSGMSMVGVPLESKEPLVGPNFTVFVPAEIVLQFPGRNFEFDIKAGGFAFYGFAQKLNYGNLDRAIRDLEGWDVANSVFTYKNKPGFGYHFGAEITVYVTKQYGVSLECNYLMGSSGFPLTGSYSGGDLAGPGETKSADYADAKIDFTGLEFSIGVFMRTGRR